MNEIRRPSEGAAPRVVLIGLASCFGCQINITNIERHLLGVLGQIELGYWQLTTSEPMPEPFDVAVIEGVMGYYDGMGLTTSRSSTWETARETGSPAVLVVDAKGASLSVLAVVEGAARAGARFVYPAFGVTMRDGQRDYFLGGLDRAFPGMGERYRKRYGSRYYCSSPKAKELWELFKDSVTEGMTIAAPGFYAPQGRWVRLEPQDAKLNEKIESFDYEGRRITNFEMEGSALAGLAALMGHRATTICTIIAQRIALDACTDYKPFVRGMIEMALDKLATLE